MDAETQTGHVSAVKLALAVRRLRAETPEIDLLHAEPIAIIGMGCRFPGGGVDPESYWTMLQEEKNAIRRVPEGRWPGQDSERASMPEHLQFGGYLDAIDGFDAAFFGITPREAQTIDPQQRLLLEVTWESLWNAGIEPESLAGSQAGVFTAIYGSDYARMLLDRAAEAEAPNAIGAAHSVAAGRIAYLLNLNGPCLAIDTACSSSLVAVHLACQSLRARECNVALCSGVSLKVLPDELFVLDRLGMLSKTSRCHAFDERADGFVPGEGCGAIVLKRLADALIDRDPIRAVVRGTAVNHDGRTTVLTAPSGLAHEAVIRQALKNGAVEARDVSYVEAHGTGTALGDPIELQAIQAVYGVSRRNTSGTDKHDAGGCVVGAVKTNLGHLEAAAGLAGLIKIVLAMEHESIPKNLHYAWLNPQSSLAGSNLRIASKQQAWRRGVRPRLAGVSSLGVSGTNAHAVLEEAPVRPNKGISPLPPRQWRRTRYWIPESKPRVRYENEASTAIRNRLPEAEIPKTETLKAETDTLKEFATLIRNGSVADEPSATRQLELRIRREAAAVMEMPEEMLPLNVSLVSLGLDSLMATDLRNRLQGMIGQELPANVAFDYASVTDLSQLIGAKLSMKEGKRCSSRSEQVEEVEL